jgi:hypothetical protein
MPQSWMISVAGHEYGPYSDAQMEAFAAEGRLIASSLVMHSDDTEFHAAEHEPALVAFFRSAKPVETAAPVHSDEPSSTHKFGRQDEEQVGERARFLIVSDMKSRSVTGLEQEIYNLGPAYPILPQMWLLISDNSLSAIRNLLVQKLGKLDALFIVDTTHDKAAWFNFGPEPDARIRKLWTKQFEAGQQRAAG